MWWFYFRTTTFYKDTIMIVKGTLKEIEEAYALRTHKLNERDGRLNKKEQMLDKREKDQKKMFDFWCFKEKQLDKERAKIETSRDILSLVIKHIDGDYE